MSESSQKRSKKSSDYPPPVIIEPSAKHKQSILLLHGRGSNAGKFGEELLRMILPNGKTLRENLPNAKFIFPTASWRRATLFKRIPITQWFDCFSLDDPNIKQHLQMDGLRETSVFIHSLLRHEIQLVGAKHVILGGLSQGCAASLFALLMWSESALGGFVGLSGWLPCEDLLSDQSPEEESYIERSGADLEERTTDTVQADQFVAVKDTDRVYLQRLSELRGEMGMCASENEVSGDDFAALATPVFLGHGVDDPKVSVSLGERAKKALEQLGINVSWNPYTGLAHWYREDELGDCLEFILSKRSFHTTLESAPEVHETGLRGKEHSLSSPNDLMRMHE